MLKDIYAKYGTDICLLPFFGAFVSEVESQVVPCCNWYGTNFVDDPSIQKNLNSDFFKEVRRAHAAGVGLELLGCQQCREAEQNFFGSLRTKTNELTVEYMEDALGMLDRIIENDYEVDGPVSIDYFPSRYCNLSCVTCYPMASTTREKHEKKFQDVKLHDSMEFEDVIPVLQHAKMISFTGGETLQQPRVLQIIDRIINEGWAKDKEIYVVTNATKYNPYIYSKLEQFKKANVTFSVDGVRNAFEYQRMGAKWDTVSKNMKDIRANHPKIGYVLNYVVTSISWTSITQTLMWAHQNKIQDILFTHVKGKPHLEVNGMPWKRFDKEMKLYRMVREALIKEDPAIKDFINVIIAVDDIWMSYQHDSQLSRELITMLKREDAARTDGMTYKDILPELEAYDDGS